MSGHRDCAYNPDACWTRHPTGRIEPEPPELARPAQTCELCEGAGWVQIPDPFFGGATTDQRCPACQDTTVRASVRRWVGDDGQKSGPA